MNDLVDDIAEKIHIVKEHAEKDSQFREALLANPKKSLDEAGITMDNIANVIAEFHPDYGVLILISFKVSPSPSPAPTKKNDDQNKQNYDFLDCHNF
jgi:hypothetical protein